MTEILQYAAFTLDPAGGNPAGVVLDASALDDPAMQQIAAEFASVPASSTAAPSELVRERLAALDYDFDALQRVMLAADLITFQLIRPLGQDAFASRNPFRVGGVVEDPATGAAAAAFGAYLRVVDPSPAVRTLRIAQGEDMGLPSELTVTIGPDDPRVRVSGTAVPLAPDRVRSAAAGGAVVAPP